ncbi:MAG: extracellular solute-binding protein, partial [Chloroflexota bacterium]
MYSKAVTRRRQFLKLGLIGAVGPVLLVACGGQTASPTAAPTAAQSSGAAAPTAAPKPAQSSSSAAPTNTPAAAGAQLLPTTTAEAVIDTSQVPKPVAKMEGDLILWHDWGNTSGGGLAMIDLVSDFMKLYPNVHMTNVYDSSQQKYLAAIASGNVPDLLKLNAFDIPTLGQRGALMSLDSYVSRDNWDMSQYFDFAVKQCSWNGKVVAITHHPDIRCMF